MMQSSLRQMKTIAIGHLSANDSGDLDLKKIATICHLCQTWHSTISLLKKKYHVVQHVKRS